MSIRFHPYACTKMHPPPTHTSSNALRYMLTLATYDSVVRESHADMYRDHTPSSMYTDRFITYRTLIMRLPKQRCHGSLVINVLYVQMYCLNPSDSSQFLHFPSLTVNNFICQHTSSLLIDLHQVHHIYHPLAIFQIFDHHWSVVSSITSQQTHHLVTDFKPPLQQLIDIIIASPI